MNSLHVLWEAVTASHTLTFFNNINDVIGIEAEFVCVLSVIGIQSLALWHLRLGLRLGLRSAPCWGRPTGCLSSDSVEREQDHMRQGHLEEAAVFFWWLQQAPFSLSHLASLYTMLPQSTFHSVSKVHDSNLFL